MELNGKVALVTGAAAGIGRATALRLAQAGARVVVLSDVREEAGEAAAAEVAQATGARADFIRADVAVWEDVARLHREIAQRHGRLDVAVNNAGVLGPYLRTDAYPLEAWHQVIGVNLTGVFHCLRAQLPALAAQGGGAIVNVASVAGLGGFPAHSAYAASKHGVVGLTRTAALEYARKNVRVNAVCPTFIETDMVAQTTAEKPDVTPEKLAALVPMGRLGQAAEVAGAILYLASDAARFLTGHCLPVDGGQRAV